MSDDPTPDDAASAYPTGPLSPAAITAESPFTLPGFFDALADGRLLGARCEACGTDMLPPRPACYQCGSRRVAIEPQPKTGGVISHTEVHRPPAAFADLAPYPLAVVELDSGARLTGRVDAPAEDVAIGARVELTIREPTDAEREAAVDYEADWPIHVFALR